MLALQKATQMKEQNEKPWSHAKEKDKSVSTMGSSCWRGKTAPAYLNWAGLFNFALQAWAEPFPGAGSTE